MANAWLIEEKAVVLAAPTGGQAIRGKGRTVSLYAKHLFALAKYRGVGWELLRWYAEVMRE